MRKLPILLLGLIITILLFFSLKLPPLSLAGCNPPQDYSGCPIARTGPKIAGNIDTRNYEQIRQAYNDADPAIANQWIPVTIIYTVEDLHPKHFQDTKGNLEAMKANGLLPIIRIWDSTDVQGSRIAGETLNQLFQAVPFPEQIVYPFNEPNLPDGPYRADPEFFAQALSAFIQGAGASPNYKIYFPPIAGHQGGREYEFTKQVLSYRMPDGRTIAQAIDAAAFTIYQWEAGQFQADLDKWVSLLRNYGVNQFIISELGPYDYTRPGQPLLQNIGDLETWKAKMSEIFARIKSDPSFLADASLINTSFFLDINGDGKADITLLVIIHADGTVEVIELLYYGGGFGWDVIYPPLACTVSNPGETDSRPVPCDACNETDLKTSSCAETFTVHDTVSYYWYEGTPEKPHCVETPWGGMIIIDPSRTTIPFVGKKGEEGRQKYLADYLEGVCPYYTGKPCPPPPYEPAEVWEETLPVGPWQAYASESLQDKYKKQMVYRAINSKTGEIREGAIHDYLVKYQGESAQLSQFAGHLPPDPGEENYEQKYLAWKESDGGKWYRLWAAVPMFSREDTPGEILPYLGSRPRDTFEIQNPEDQVEKVPHLARLYEVSKALHQLLLPWRGGETEVQGKAKTIIASAKEKVLGEKTLLAQIDPIRTPQGCKFLYGTPDCNCCAMGNCLGRATLNPIPNKMGPLCGWTECEGGEPDFCGTTTTPPEEAICGLPAAVSVASCNQPALTDSNPNDDLCCEPIRIELSALDIFKNPRYEKCVENPKVCDKTVEENVQRQVGIMLSHPYLTEIWNYTTAPDKGFFNIFRPATVPEFEDLDAASKIEYYYKGSQKSVVPATGNFYFPYLGGIQKAKEWVIRTLYPK